MKKGNFIRQFCSINPRKTYIKCCVQNGDKLVPKIIVKLLYHLQKNKGWLHFYLIRKTNFYQNSLIRGCVIPPKFIYTLDRCAWRFGWKNKSFNSHKLFLNRKRICQEVKWNFVLYLSCFRNAWLFKYWYNTINGYCLWRPK